MLDPAISCFFEERKEAWLKKNLKASMEEYEKKECELECETVFSLENWLPNAAKRAGQISMATHPCTFSHPSARKNKNGYVTSVVAKVTSINNGLLISGNVDVTTDALGNAAALDVYKFLTLEMADQQTLLAHIQESTELAKALLSIRSESYDILKTGFLAMAETKAENITSSKIKQVYFPVDDDYHQLSIMTNSGIMYQLRKRLDDYRFSDQIKALRELKKKNELSEQGFTEIFDLTTIGYGGTKPQNISVLNNQNGGKTYLLQSMPPSINKRTIHFPKTNFFTESFRQYEYIDVLHALHKIFKTDFNKVNIREGRDYRIQELVDRIIDKMWAVRSVSKDQYHQGSSQLKLNQKIWLCHENAEQREATDDWLEKLTKDIASWMIRTYEQTLGKQAIKLGEAERLKFLEIVSNNKESFR